MSLSAGHRLGIYDVLAPLGQGGMGEVYRARDTKLGRDVAIKILPELADGSAERVARFKREAQLLAALNHPNIGGIYGLDESGSTHFLVLELVDGETLADRIGRDGRLPILDALTVARQLLDALDAAHERGIIHRDLKPANIMFTAGGQVKVLDFGLAKALEAQSSPDILNSPTLTLAATQAGMILGTAAYMSPEQAKGRTADKRSDIWAFGCVLFEMLSGQRAFRGEDVSDTLAMVLRGDPDWTLLPDDTPPHITTLLQRCLQRDRNLRLRDVSIVTFLLDQPSTPAALDRPASSFPWRVVALTSMGLAAVLATALFVRSTASSPAAPPARLLHFTVDVPPTASMVRAAASLNQQGVTSPLALSPDGRELAFVVDRGRDRRIWIRPLDQTEAHEVAGTDGASGIFWSPDSEFIAFFADGLLKKVPRSGGAPQRLCEVPDHRGGTWGSKGDILFGLSGSPLKRIPQTGGVPVEVTKLEDGESFHGRPHFLPDGDHFLFKTSGASNMLYLASLSSPERKLVLNATDTSNVVYASGHLLYVLSGVLMAHPFNLSTLALEGEPFRIADQVKGSGAPPVGFFSASQTGILAFQSGSGVGDTQLQWVDRTGRVQTVGEPGLYAGAIELSADQKRALVSMTEPAKSVRDVWMFDLVRGFPSRVTTDPADDTQGIWSPSGDRFAYSSVKDSPQRRLGLYVRSLTDGSDTKLYVDKANIYANSWSPDGKFVFMTSAQNGSYDILAMPVEGGNPISVLSSSFAERDGRISPDGRWLAYDSNETGREEVYLTPFPRRELRIRVSANGGADARWNPNGREVFFRGSDGRLTAASVTFRGEGVEVGAVTPLFDLTSRVLRAGFTIGADGRKFLVAGDAGAAGAEEFLEVVVDWLAASKH